MIDLSNIARELPIKLFTLPPRSINYPFLLVHTDNYRELYTRKFDLAIIDIQVHRFVKHNDYPVDFIRRYTKLCLSLASVFKDRLVVVAPDLPYDPVHFRGAQYSDNIRKTYRYHAVFRALEPKLHQYGTQVMYVLQHRQTLESLRYSANILLDIVHREPEMIGIGSLCVERSPKRDMVFIREARKLFPKAWLHGFGIHLSTLKYISQVCEIQSFDSQSWERKRALVNRGLSNWRPWRELQSFDSDSWTRPVNQLVLKVIKATKRFSCKTERQRVIYFMCYLARLCELCYRHDLAHGIYKQLGIEHEYGTILTYMR